MNQSFTKLFSSLLESTLWCEADHIRIVWIAMLAMADRKGQVAASIPGLANRARVTIEQAQSALECFRKPDKYSRTPDNEGRRISDIEGGWQILNYQKYRELRDNEAIKESKRRYINRRRSEEKQADNGVDSEHLHTSTVDRSRPKQKHTASEAAFASPAAQKAAPEPFVKPTPETVARFGQMLREAALGTSPIERNGTATPFSEATPTKTAPHE